MTLPTPLEVWAYSWIAFLAVTNAIQFFAHWYFHHRGTLYEGEGAEEEA